MKRVRAFCEFPAGLAAVSLRLHGGPHCRPPISRMGNKAGYAEVILAALGLRSGQGAGAYLWAEADPDVAALLRAYPNPEMLRRIAEIIRGWADEEPRALWERLRAERKARATPVGAPDTASWIIEGVWSFRRCEPVATPGLNPLSGEASNAGAEETAARCHTLAEYATIVASNRLVNVAGPDLMNTGKGGTTFGGGEFATPAADVAEAFERVAGDVAAHSTLAAWSRGNQADGSYMGPDRPSNCHPPGWTACITAMGLSKRHTLVADEVIREAGRWPPVLVLPTIPTAAEVSAWLGTPGDLDGVILYQDPPYLGTTGYQSDIPRADVVATALDFAAMGATVCVSEATPVEELVAHGWHVVEITDGRRGQTRTFSAQKREFLTMNREPAHRIASQVGLFG